MLFYLIFTVTPVNHLLIFIFVYSSFIQQKDRSVSTRLIANSGSKTIVHTVLLQVILFKKKKKLSAVPTCMSLTNWQTLLHCIYHVMAPCLGVLVY